MSKKYFILFFKIILIAAVFIVHQSFFLKLDWRFNLYPAILVFVLFLFDLKPAFFWLLGLGFLADLFSFLPFGFNLSAFFCLILITYFLNKNLITNRSFFSLLMLAAIATVFFNFFLFLAFKFFGRADLVGAFALNMGIIGFQLLTNLIFIFLAFFIASLFSRRSRSDYIAN
jgi:hypothetical protein